MKVRGCFVVLLEFRELFDSVVSDSSYDLNKSLREEKAVDFNESFYDNEELKEYVKSIEKYPVLSVKEVNALAFKVYNGDKKAYEDLINSSLRTVVKYAMYFANPNISIMDLIQEGNVSLIKSIKKFDMSKGSDFNRFLLHGMIYDLHRYIDDNSKIIRLPYRTYTDFVKIEKFKDNYFKEFGKVPTSDIICKGTGISLRAYNRYVKYNMFDMKVVSYFVPVGDTDFYMQDFIPDDTYKNEEDIETVERNIMKQDLSDWLKSHLTEREYKHLYYRFGFDGHDPRSLEEVGIIFNVTRLRSEQVERKAMRKLKGSEEYLSMRSYIS